MRLIPVIEIKRCRFVRGFGVNLGAAPATVTESAAAKRYFKPLAVERAIAFHLAGEAAQGGFARDSAAFRPA
jgi:hypothetical protein